MSERRYENVTKPHWGDTPTTYAPELQRALDDIDARLTALEAIHTKPHETCANGQGTSKSRTDEPQENGATCENDPTLPDAQAGRNSQVSGWVTVGDAEMLLSGQGYEVMFDPMLDPIHLKGPTIRATLSLHLSPAMAEFYDLDIEDDAQAAESSESAQDTVEMGAESLPATGDESGGKHHAQSDDSRGCELVEEK